MSRQLPELENILRLLVTEHEKLLNQLLSQQAAMKKLDLKALEEFSQQQEGTRMRITTLDQRRKVLVTQIALTLRMQGTPTLTKLAEALPAGTNGNLLVLRDQLKDVMTKIAAQTQLASRIAGAVLGHLNTAVRYLAGAVEQAGLYTKHGTPNVSQRIGMIEAVG